MLDYLTTRWYTALGKFGSKNLRITIRSLKNYSQEIFINSLTELKYPSYSQFTDIDFAYEDFISKTISVVDKIAPEKKVRVKGSNQDWFDNEVHEAIRNHNIIAHLWKNQINIMRFI